MRTVLLPNGFAFVACRFNRKVIFMTFRSDLFHEAAHRTKGWNGICYFTVRKCLTGLRVRHFWGHSQKCEKRLLAFSCVSVRMEQLGSYWTDFHEI
jgi:hypothetical protein